MSFDLKVVDLQYKILLLGETKVGKTSLIIRYVDNKFEEGGLSTLGVDMRNKYIQLEGKKIKLDIWDTAGEERFRSIAKNYFRIAHAIIFVCDLTSEETFKMLKFWMEDSKNNVDPNVEIILAANKSDLIEKREVSEKKLKDFSSKNNMQYFETSAKTGKGVEDLFNALINKLFLKKDVGVVLPDDESSNKAKKIQNQQKDDKNNSNKCNC